MGSGCDSVGRTVASDFRGPRFESSYRRNLYLMLIVNCIEKKKITKKRPRMAHFFYRKKLCKAKFALTNIQIMEVTKNYLLLCLFT